MKQMFLIKKCKWAYVQTLQRDAVRASAISGAVPPNWRKTCTAGTEGGNLQTLAAYTSVATFGKWIRPWVIILTFPSNHSITL